MKRFNTCALFALAVSAFCLMGFVHVPENPEIKITRFYGGRAAAVCYSFDDGLQNQVDQAIPLLNKYDFKATFFIIPAKIRNANGTDASGKLGSEDNMTWDEVRQMAANGHEIASHSWSHTKNLKTLSDAKLQEEIDLADSLILKETGIFPQTFAYPWNGFDSHVHDAVYQHHIAAREAQFGIGAKFTTEEGNAWIDQLIINQTWGITMIHGITKNFDALSSPDVLDRHFKYVKSLDQQIWVTTYASIFKYITERDSTAVHVSYHSAHHLVCTLSNRLNTKIYNQPLTLAVDCKQPIIKPIVLQAGRQLPAILQHRNVILVNVSPVAGPVDISW